MLRIMGLRSLVTGDLLLDFWGRYIDRTIDFNSFRQAGMSIHSFFTTTSVPVTYTCVDLELLICYYICMFYLRPLQVKDYSRTAKRAWAFG